MNKFERQNVTIRRGRCAILACLVVAASSPVGQYAAAQEPASIYQSDGHLGDLWVLAGETIDIDTDGPNMSGAVVGQRR